jgi:thymidylate synthase-like protein
LTHIASIAHAISNNAHFERQYARKVRALLANEPVNRGPAHAMNDDTTSLTHELMHVTEVFDVRDLHEGWAALVKPNLPWAEDHFLERVGGQPLNPAPSEQWWPFARKGNEDHKKDKQFSHTYPERFWPRFANEGGKMKHSERVVATPIVGIRFEYGDLEDLTHVLKTNPNTRQAYLPIWFPEDLNAACHQERVPCSLGYHFIMNDHKLDCVYTMRSCDIVRFYRDDIYMAGRLLQWVCEVIGTVPGNLVVHIDNLHCFPGDRLFLEQFIRQTEASSDPRASYNFGALG